MIVAIVCYFGLVGAALLIAKLLSRGMEDERDQFGEDQYLAESFREQSHK